jgi:hypothetical protein
MQRVPMSAARQKVSCANCGQRLKVPDPPEMRTMQAVLPPPKPAKGRKQWFYEEGGKQRGPVSWAELKRMAADGELSPEDRVWGEGMAAWKEARLIPNLFPKHTDGPPPLEEPAQAGKWLEGCGVVIFGLLVGLAIVLFVGYLVWKHMKQAETTAPTTVSTSKRI